MHLTTFLFEQRYRKLGRKRAQMSATYKLLVLSASAEAATSSLL